jgi:calcineurin-like phosphoesterase family protein
MSDVWFTSDTHAFHNRIMEFCPDTRRGKDCEEMTWLLVDAWNKDVKPGDRVYHIGDFSFGGKEKVEKFAKALNGQIHLITGNHDHMIRKTDTLRAYFASVWEVKRLKVGDAQFVMSHAPYAEWVDCHKGVIHLHGHTHGNIQNLQWQQQFKIMDVGIDARPDNSMKLWNIDEVLQKMEKRENMNHHD